MKQGMNECYDLNSYVGQEVDRDCHIYFFQSGTCSLIYTCPEGMAEPGQRGKWCQAPSNVQNQSFLNLEEKKNVELT